MDLALISRPVAATTGAADAGAPRRFPRLAGTGVPADGKERASFDAPPLPDVFEEQDPERWDGMA